MVPEQTGTLHIFFGAAPGVGKTWAMVDAAQQRRAEGLDVAIGYVDTHDHPEFAGLLSGLEIIPRQKIDYEGISVSKMNLDAILSRKPDLVLIDELAHTNIRGGRHGKRYEDVIEILQAGISVYTTLNVQHVSSMADAVARLTGIQVREQVPDFVLEMATSIRLIDLAPDELLSRLTKHLKDPHQDIFTPTTLVSLREWALRIAAARVDDDVRKLSSASHQEAWATSSRILVGISASPNNERLIQAAYRLAIEMRTTLLAVHIQTRAESRLDQDAQTRILHHLQLAKNLGAETLTVAGESVAATVIDIANRYNVSRVVIGRSKRQGLFGRARSMSDELIDLSDTLDIIILSG